MQIQITNTLKNTFYLAKEKEFYKLIDSKQKENTFIKILVDNIFAFKYIKSQGKEL